MLPPPLPVGLCWCRLIFLYSYSFIIPGIFSFFTTFILCFSFLCFHAFGFETPPCIFTFSSLNFHLSISPEFPPFSSTFHSRSFVSHFFCFALPFHPRSHVSFFSVSFQSLGNRRPCDAFRDFLPSLLSSFSLYLFHLAILAPLISLLHILSPFSFLCFIPLSGAPRTSPSLFPSGLSFLQLASPEHPFSKRPGRYFLG